MGDTNYFGRLHEAYRAGYNEVEETDYVGFEEAARLVGYSIGQLADAFNIGLSPAAMQRDDRLMGRDEKPDGIDAVVEDSPDKPIDT